VNASAATIAAPPGTLLVAVRGVGLRFPGGGGLPATDLDVRAGELVVVRGPSGSGKSTLLAILAGWATPDEGELEWGPPLASPAARLRWDTIAVLLQVLAPATELSILENVTFPLRASGVGAAEARRRALDALDALGAADLADRAIAAVSMGQQQRAMLARAIVSEPTLLLVDEPTSHQDPDHAGSVVDQLRAVAHRHGGCLIATHDELVIARADRVVTL
jgi:putative ABC transport system ATP-binding protein